MNDNPEQSLVVIDHSIIRLVDGTEIPTISPETEIREMDGKQCVFYNGEYICDLGRKKALEKHWHHEEPGYSVGRCRMITRAGERCRLGTRPGWDLCYKHGAGTKERPAGNPNLMRGRFGVHLPDHLVERYDEFINDPDIISVRGDIGLVDTRISECLDRLERADTDVAWTKVKLVARRLENLLDGDVDEIDLDVLDKIQETLAEAVEAQQNDIELWSEITKLLEQRRKLAETERRTIVDSRQMLTVEEANMFLAYVLASIQRNVSSAEERQRIADDMRRFIK